MVAAETGQLVKIARNETDRGVFTVQVADVPTSTLRQKTKRSGKSPQKLMQNVNATLEPIHENNDEIFEDKQISESTYPSTLESDRKVDTPVRCSKSTELLLNLDTLEEELDNVPDISVDTDIVTVLSGLPPRPKCKRKVLPPSVTCNNINEKKADMNRQQKRNKVLKLRKEICKTLESTKRSVSRNTQIATCKRTMQPLSEICRPKSTGKGVCVVRLSDLSSKNSRSLTDLSSIMTRLTNERLDVSHLRSMTRLSMQQSDGDISAGSNNTIFEESGALSTPRQSPDSDVTYDTLSSSRKLKTACCLKGSDLASFYHMWGRDRNNRPFDKKDNGKFRLNVHRDCLCAIRNCNRKCFDQRQSVLPPISPPSKLSSKTV